MPVYETGHARNVQRFEELISFVTSWGASYNPSNTAINVAALNAKLTASNTGLDTVTTKLTLQKTEVNERENTFAGVRKLVTRMVNYYESTGAPENMVDDAKALKRKIDGKRAEALDSAGGGDGEGGSESVSVSQQSYTQLTQFFGQLVDLLQNDAAYDPNEVALQTATLLSLHADMEAANSSVTGANTQLSNARATRNDVLYADDTGLVDLAMLVKKYVKAAYGTDSSEYGQIKGLEFRRPSGS